MNAVFKMKLTTETWLFMLCCCVSHVYCCTWSTKDMRAVCDTITSVSIEGNDTWSNLFIDSQRVVAYGIRPNSFTRVPNLKDLRITNVDAIEPEAFNGLNKLDKLTIMKSFIDEVPKVFDNLPILWLEIVNSKIKNVAPGLFDNLSGVRNVNFQENEITEVKTGIYNNTLIFQLYLDNNLIASIDDNAFIDMEYLELLSLSRNRLTTFESFRILGTSNSLKTIRLNNNKISKFTTKLLESAPYLNLVSIENNLIESIENGAFDKVPVINSIDLSNNSLTEIQPKIFPISGMKNVEHLYLHKNRFTYIYKSLLVRVPKLIYISYGGNPLQCACLEDIKRWAVNITILCQDQYYSGKYPSCVKSALSETECLYDDELTSNLYDKFNTDLAKYPEFPGLCMPKIKTLIIYAS